MTTKIIRYSFYTLFFFTPLFFLPFNNELFEYNKMMLVYGLATLITGTWLIKMIHEKKLILRSTPLDIPILLFLVSQILSTIFSTDPHTSWWGYYSRSNGGLMSIISYTLLFYALISNFTKEDVIPLLKSILLGGLLVSLYAIPEHFGVSPSCIILTGQATATCWVQDVQARVFATLGQPNWLAAYLAMLIFPTFYLTLQAKTNMSKFFYGSLIIIFYLAFTFTYSRGAMLGVVGGFLVLAALGVVALSKNKSEFSKGKITTVIPILVGLVLVNLLFGSALTGDFRLLKQSAPPSRPSITGSALPSGTQLETGGTESGQIRLIVWKGAIDIFKHYPLFGSGVETFAYSYYNFRPVEHNKVSEWDFLYNKAHNEFLNYLATTGAVGFISYLVLISAFIIYSIRQIVFSKNSNKLLTSLLLAGYVSYLIQNIFGFSVVMIALLFFIFPALSVLNTESVKEIKVKDHVVFSRLTFFTSILYKRSLYSKVAKIGLGVITALFLLTLINNWRADTYYKIGNDYTDVDTGKAYNSLLNAVLLNDSEPLYHSDFGYAAAAASTALFEKDATTSSQLKEQAIKETNRALAKSPSNVSLWRTAIRTYYMLATIDPSLQDKTIEVMDHTISLAPTDPKLYYNKALILGQFGKNEEGIAALDKAIELKPNYREAHFTLALFYETAGNKEKALEEMNYVLKLVPNDPDALSKINQLQSGTTEK